jgi:hypothetical protein
MQLLPCTPLLPVMVATHLLPIGWKRILASLSLMPFSGFFLLSTNGGRQRAYIPLQTDNGSNCKEPSIMTRINITRRAFQIQS